MGIRQFVNYEAQAAMELEAIADETERDAYAYEIRSPKLEIGVSPLLSGIIADRRANVAQPVIAARFHNSIAQMTREVCLRLRAQFDVNQVALSGGVWQNMTLLQKTISLLRAENFVVYFHRRIPANDGGIALGQAVIAAHAQRGG
jgi:hydrogenase maturation protein HypF